MTAEPTLSKRAILLPILALVALGVVLRYTFVNLLTKTTGTWIGGVDSPHRADASTSTESTSTEAKGPSSV